MLRIGLRALVDARPLILRPSSLAHAGFENDYDVFSDGKVVGRIYDGSNPSGGPWFWGLAYGNHKDRTPTHGHEHSREAAMVAFAKSWWRE